MQASKEAKKQSTAVTRCLLLASLLLCLPVSLRATTISGTIKDPAGAGITGRLELTLSAPGRVNDPALLLIQPKVTCAISNGAIAAGCTVRGNDTIVEPAGTYYCLRIVASGGKELMAGKKYVVTGSTLDLGAVEPGGRCK